MSGIPLCKIITKSTGKKEKGRKKKRIQRKKNSTGPTQHFPPKQVLLDNFRYLSY